MLPVFFFFVFFLKPSNFGRLSVGTLATMLAEFPQLGTSHGNKANAKNWLFKKANRPLCRLGFGKFRMQRCLRKLCAP